MSRTEQLRDDIDRGRTGDKIPHGDPAAAPLGGDDEAAGAAPGPQVVDQARRDETRTRPAEPPPNTARPEKAGQKPWLYLAVCAVLLALLAAGFWFG